MKPSFLLFLWALCGLAVLPACDVALSDDDDSTASDDDDTSDDDDDASDDDDTSDDDDSSPEPVAAPAGSVLCASGGQASSAGGLTAVLCTGPSSTGSVHSSSTDSGSLTLQSGPITRIAP